MQTPEQKRAYMVRWRAANVEHERAYRKRYEAEHREERQNKKAAMRAAKRAEINDYARAYYARKREERLAYAAAYRQANKVLVKIRTKAWRDANKEAARAAQKSWVSRHPQANRVYIGRRRALKRGNGGKLSKGITKKLMNAQGGWCVYCAATLNVGYHLDHKIPLSRGGTHTDDNVQLTCPLCNMRKHNKTHEEFLETLRAAA